jgi:hypothetical protein
VILELLARSPEDGCGSRLADAHLDAGDLGVIETLKENQVAAVIDDGDDHPGVLFLRVGLGGSGDFLRRLQCQLIVS